jgi:hypothetical protein
MIFSSVGDGVRRNRHWADDPYQTGSDRGFFMAETTTQNNLTEDRLFTAIRQSCKRFQIVSLNRQIEICKTLLTENPPIDVAILGQFKAGKSSFLNGLLGKHILPTGVVPVTTVITRLQYGPEERAKVTYFNDPGPISPCKNCLNSSPNRETQTMPRMWMWWMWRRRS